MNDLQVEKVKKFINDKTMSGAVREVVLASFLKSKPNKDVYQLAASRIAIDLLEEAWKDLSKYRSEEEKEVKISAQVGL